VGVYKCVVVHKRVVVYLTFRIAYARADPDPLGLKRSERDYVLPGAGGQGTKMRERPTYKSSAKPRADWLVKVARIGLGFAYSLSCKKLMYLIN
jgi:hypothetical protein